MKKELSKLETLTVRELNRATLARQMLLAREAVGPVEAIERLAGLQAQYSPSPYLALWTRLHGFTKEQFTDLLLGRQLVKTTLMRGTLHIVSVSDYKVFAAALAGALEAVWAKPSRDAGLDVKALREMLLDFASEPRTRDEIVQFLETQVPPDPARQPFLLWHAANARGYLMRPPPSGTWGYHGVSRYLAARVWLGEWEHPAPEDAMLGLIRRYLAAFGPATRSDIQQWSGLQRVTPVDTALKALDDELVLFKDEQGKQLYDLAGAPRPEASVPAPLRFLPKWDSLLLAHQNRERALPARYRKTVIKINGDVIPTFLVDGVVAGMWSSKLERGAATLRLEPFEGLHPAVASELEEEGHKLLRFIEPEAGSYGVVVTSAPE